MRNWVKLKSVQTLLRIACLANRKSYVVIIYANACEKLTKVKMHKAEVGSNIAQKCENFTKSEIYSNIAQNHFHSSQFDL